LHFTDQHTNDVYTKSFQITFGVVPHNCPAHQICSHRRGGHPWGRQQQPWPGWHHPSWHLRAPGQWSWAPPPLGEPPRSSIASQSGPIQHKTGFKTVYRQLIQGIGVSCSNTVCNSSTQAEVFVCPDLPANKRQVVSHALCRQECEYMLCPA
jgi:hypothetical protein